MTRCLGSIKHEFPTIENVLYGNGTSFTTDLRVGDFIIIDDIPRQVTAIHSDVELEIDSAYPNFIGGKSYQKIATGITVTDDGRVGINTTTPGETFDIEFEAADADTVDVEMGQAAIEPSSTFISLRSPNASQFFIRVDNSGNLTTSSVKP